jgi:hypothetical protein
MAFRIVSPSHVHLGFVTHHQGSRDSCTKRALPGFFKKLTVIAGLLLSVEPAEADPTTTTPDPPARKTIPSVGPSGFAPSWDLDGTYVWLGPSGAGSHVDGAWDSTFGVDLAVVRIRERARLAAIGGSIGASRWTVRGGGRIWFDALVGTRLGRMIGVSAGPLVELSDVAHPRIGGSIGIWCFLGVTPFARVGTVQDLGMFGEVGIHIALPVFKRRSSRR